jgi:hypothetical protein
MKKIAVTLLVLISTTSFAMDFSQLVGSYEVTSDFAPVVNHITIDSEGVVTLTEQSPYGLLECVGEAVIKGAIFESVVTCENGAEFSQRIDLSGITNYQKFTANVYSSLYDMELPMNFIKR